jgi:hypothetical protein
MCCTQRHSRCGAAELLQESSGTVPLGAALQSASIYMLPKDELDDLSGRLLVCGPALAQGYVSISAVAVHGGQHPNSSLEAPCAGNVSAIAGSAGQDPDAGVSLKAFPAITTLSNLRHAGGFVCVCRNVLSSLTLVSGCAVASIMHGICYARALAHHLIAVNCTKPACMNACAGSVLSLEAATAAVIEPMTSSRRIIACRQRMIACRQSACDNLSQHGSCVPAFVTSDVGRLVEHRCHFEGRSDDLFKLGGIMYNLLELERRLEVRLSSAHVPQLMFDVGI